jgi:hypothetical protein
MIDLCFATTFVSAGKHRVLAEMRDVAEEVSRIDLEIARAAQQDDHEAMRKVLYEARVAEASVKRVLHHSKELNLDLKAPGGLSSKSKIDLLKKLKVNDAHEKQTEDSINDLHTVLASDKNNRKKAREESQRFLNSLKLALPAPRGMLKNGEPVNSQIKHNLKEGYKEVKKLLTIRFHELEEAKKSGSKATSMPRQKSSRNSAGQLAGLIADFGRAEADWERPDLSDDDDSSVYPRRARAGACAATSCAGPRPSSAARRQPCAAQRAVRSRRRRRGGCARTRWSTRSRPTSRW